MAGTALYCSMTDVRNRLSAEGVNLRLDDFPEDADGDILNEAAAIIDEHAGPRYGTNLPNSRIVNQWAANIAACLLCERRGNPPPLGMSRKFDRTMKSLEAVLSHGRQITDIAEMKTSCPVLSNVHTQMFPFPHTVVEAGARRSTGTPEGYTQTKDLIDRYVYDWVI